MKKRILVLLVALFGFSNVAFSAAGDACPLGGGDKKDVSSATAYGSNCSYQPDSFTIKIYEMKLCSSAPTAPTTSAVTVTTSCQDVMTNATGSTVTVVKGSNTALTGTITRPANGTYTHAYIRIGKDFLIKDAEEFTSSHTGSRSGTGKFCATHETSGVVCDTSAVTAGEQTMALNDMDGPAGSFVDSKTGISTSEGTLAAYLVASSYKLSATSGAVEYVVGTQAFTTPIVITDATTKMNAAFNTTTGLSVFDGGTLNMVQGPFSLKLTVE